MASATDVNRSGNKANGPKPNARKPKAQVTANGPSAKAGLQGGTQQVSIAGESVIIGGDIIIAINATHIETRITSMDDLSTLLEEYTSPNQTVNVTIVRNNQTMTLPVELGTRPPPT